MPSETFLFADEPEPEVKQPHKEPAQLLLDFLQRWPKTTISSKEIYQYAPRAIRFDRENAIRSAEVLARHGWLNAIKPRQRNYRIWQIVRKEPVVHPTVAG
jgi:hypothetical protein